MQIRPRHLALLLVVVLAFAFVQSSEYYLGGPNRTWELVVYLIGLAGLVAAGGLLVATIVPASVLMLTPAQRDRCLTLAFALVVGTLLTAAILRGYSAYYLHEHPEG